MNARKKGIDDPFFNEFVYHTIATTSRDVLSKLPTSLLQHTHTPARMKRFADKASLELKIEMLSRLGVDCAVFFSMPDYLKTESIQETYKAYKENNRLHDLNQMIQQKGFCFTSRDVMAILAVKAMNCHSETYMLNRQYSTLAAAIANAKDIDQKIPDIDLQKGAMQDHKLIATLLLHNLMQQTFVDSNTGYSERELMVLLFLYMRRRKDNGFDHYTTLAIIQTHFQNTYAKSRISQTLTLLHRALHVDKFPGKSQYAISATGIGVVTSYIARLINLTLAY